MDASMESAHAHTLADAVWPPGACALDHTGKPDSSAGCVVCSDAGISLRVVALEGDDALCEDAAGNQTLIAVELVQPVQIGEVVLAHGGVAIGRCGTLSAAGAQAGGEGDDEVRQ